MGAALILYLDRFTRYGVYSIVSVADRFRWLDVYIVESPSVFYSLVDIVYSRYRKCLVGFSLMTTRVADENYLALLRDLVEYSRRRNCISIAGGPHASGDPIGTLFSLGFDIAVVGEGEPAIEDLYLYANNIIELSEVRNIVYRDGYGSYRVGKKAPPIDLDKYPPFPYWRHLYMPIEITRGCFHGCWFCQVSYIHGFRIRHRSVDNIIKYAKIMVEDSGVRDIRFITPDALSYGLRDPRRRANVEALEELLNSLHKALQYYNARIFLGSFPSEVRPEHVDEETAALLKKYVSNKEVIVGAQSGSERILKKIHRGHTVEDVVNAVDILLKTGFRPSVDFIFGFPGETEEDMLESVKLAQRLVEKGARIHLHYYLPLPGTPLFPQKPTPIPDRVRNEIMRLIGRGAAYGDFLEQEKLSKRIVDLVERGVIRPGTRRQYHIVHSLI
ncbi:TIGR04013 family B12-binding domain/radical SAM domain-containing protein [Thermogladius sp. 4427co]|uniref:TIGR04013 family B12-binding domain/radical SAM domain-containing protein n=1 Tax=Thermogladius sp. 4427co TaxID=3450718 RepID=UPI003F796B64